MKTNELPGFRDELLKGKEIVSFSAKRLVIVQRGGGAGGLQKQDSRFKMPATSYVGIPPEVIENKVGYTQRFWV